MNKIKRPIPVPPTKAGGVVTNTNKAVDIDSNNKDQNEDEGVLKYERHKKIMNEMGEREIKVIYEYRQLKVTYQRQSFVFGDKVFYKNDVWVVCALFPLKLGISIIPLSVVEEKGLFPFREHKRYLRLPEYAIFNDINKLKDLPSNNKGKSN